LLPASTCSRHDVARLRVEYFQRQHVVAAEAGNRAGNGRLEVFADRHLARDLAGDALVGRTFHQPQRLLHPIVRKYLEEGRLLERDREGDFECAVEERLAGGVDEVREDDGVEVGERRRRGAAGQRCQERTERDQQHQDSGNAHPPRAGPERLQRGLGHDPAQRVHFLFARRQHGGKGRG